MDNIYALKAEDLSHLGGAMGTEYTTNSILGYFADIEDAKKEAEKHYEGKLKWKKNGKKGLTTGDLNWVMYYIVPIRVK